jgi:sugar lactone lactonase YvrE
VSATNVTSASYSYQGTVTGSPATVTSSATANATATYVAITGALQVTITGLPPGANANLLVTGPGGYSQAVVGTQLLPTLAPGTYNIAVNPTRVSGSIVDQVYTGSGTSASVAAGTTVPASVSYSALGGTGKLWIALSGSLVGYDSSQLTTSGSPPPSVSIAITNGEAVAFDRAGNAWVARLSSNLLMFAASQLVASGSPTPTVTIGGPSIPNTNSIAFDSAGNSWLANSTISTIVEFNVAQLASSGTPTANITISNNGGSLNRPFGLAFESNGNLWAANLISNTLVMFTPDQLAATGNPVPAVTLSASGGSITRPLGLALDSSNNLWVSNFTTNTIVKFTPAQRSTSSSPTPAVTLLAASGSLNLPSCLAFDNGGNLWVVNRGARTIVQFSASQLASSGSPTPVVTIGGLGTIDVGLCAFDPAPVAVPIYQ